MPSARNATFTPAPVKPSDRAVTAPFAVESVRVSASPSGSSCGVAEHAPGGVCAGRGRACAPGARRPAAPPPAGAGAPSARPRGPVP